MAREVIENALRLRPKGNPACSVHHNAIGKPLSDISLPLEMVDRRRIGGNRQILHITVVSRTNRNVRPLQNAFPRATSVYMLREVADHRKLRPYVIEQPIRYYSIDRHAILQLPFYPPYVLGLAIDDYVFQINGEFRKFIQIRDHEIIVARKTQASSDGFKVIRDITPRPVDYRGD
jgi:hypothetical protein